MLVITKTNIVCIDFSRTILIGGNTFVAFIHLSIGILQSLRYSNIHTIPNFFIINFENQFFSHLEIHCKCRSN